MLKEKEIRKLKSPFISRQEKEKILNDFTIRELIYFIEYEKKGFEIVYKFNKDKIIEIMKDTVFGNSYPLYQKIPKKYFTSSFLNEIINEGNIVSILETNRIEETIKVNIINNIKLTSGVIYKVLSDLYISDSIKKLVFDTNKQIIENMPINNWVKLLINKNIPLDIKYNIRQNDIATYLSELLLLNNKDFDIRREIIEKYDNDTLFEPIKLEMDKIISSLTFIPSDELYNVVMKKRFNLNEKEIEEIDSIIVYSKNISRFSSRELSLIKMYAVVKKTPEKISEEITDDMLQIFLDNIKVFPEDIITTILNKKMNLSNEEIKEITSVINSHRMVSVEWPNVINTYIIARRTPEKITDDMLQIFLDNIEYFPEDIITTILNKKMNLSNEQINDVIEIKNSNDIPYSSTFAKIYAIINIMPNRISELITDVELSKFLTYYSFCFSDELVEVVLNKRFNLNKEEIKEIIPIIKKLYGSNKINFIEIYKMIKEPSENINIDDSKLEILLRDVYTIPEEAFIMIFNKILNLDSLALTKLYNVLKFYDGDKLRFTKNFPMVEYFLEGIMDSNIFYQYSLNISYDYVTGITNIINSGLDNFKKVKEYFFNNIYDKTESSQMKVNNLINLIKNYNAYPELCLDIIQKNKILTEEEKKDILFLFVQNEEISEFERPKTLEECHSLINRRIEKYKFKLATEQLDEVKDIVCMILFNHSTSELESYLQMFGNTLEMEKLIFNNKGNEEIINLASEMEIYTSLIEDILLCDDIEKLKSIATNILNNYETIFTKFSMNIGFEEKMRYLYAIESSINLTKITSSNESSVKEINRSNKYGVDTFDFSDKEYVLFAHAMSGRETVEQLVNGVATGVSNFICLSPISYRNQVYYNVGNDIIIFGYDNFPQENFIGSSITNMGSNSAISSYSSEVRGLRRTQRGILETSAAVGRFNSEVLALREGLKPSYIILPGGREPTLEEISIARKYGLKFAITQKLSEKVKNPIKIVDQTEKKEEQTKLVEDLKLLKDRLLKTQKTTGSRKIAILADPHALFEPTLAVLEDARKKGINEIYSLGDNIGTGPNPSEVIELLEKYGVKSVKGNHELYATEGVETFRRHLEHAGGMLAYNEALTNSTWTRQSLTSNQIKSIEMYPTSRELLIGGKKILLCHSINDFNTGKMVVDKESYDRVFAGHIHFRGINENISTLRGTGIGYGGENEGQAYYMILTEKPEGGYDIEEVYVPFDTINLYHSINLSNMPDNEKNKITSWSGAKKGKY